MRGEWVRVLALLDCLFTGVNFSARSACAWLPGVLAIRAIPHRGPAVIWHHILHAYWPIPLEARNSDLKLGIREFQALGAVMHFSKFHWFAYKSRTRDPIALNLLSKCLWKSPLQERSTKVGYWRSSFWAMSRRKGLNLIFLGFFWPCRNCRSEILAPTRRSKEFRPRRDVT